MNDIAAALAKLAGIRRAIQSLLDETSTRHGNRPHTHFSPMDAGSLFVVSAKQVQVLKERLSELYGDLPEVETEPTTPMAEGSSEPMHFSDAATVRDEIERNKTFEVRRKAYLAEQQRPRTADELQATADAEIVARYMGEVLAWDDPDLPRLEAARKRIKERRLAAEHAVATTAA